MDTLPQLIAARRRIREQSESYWMVNRPEEREELRARIDRINERIDSLAPLRPTEFDSNPFAGL